MIEGEAEARDERIARLAAEMRPPLPLPSRPINTGAERTTFLTIVVAQSMITLGVTIWSIAHWRLALIGFAVALVTSFGVVILAARQRSRVLRLVKAHTGLICPRCRYPLDTLPLSADRCPECAAAADRLEIVRMWRRNYAISAREAPDPAALDAGA